MPSTSRISGPALAPWTPFVSEALAQQHPSHQPAHENCRAGGLRTKALHDGPRGWCRAGPAADRAATGILVALPASSLSWSVTIDSRSEGRRVGGSTALWAGADRWPVGPRPNGSLQEVTRSSTPSRSIAFHGLMMASTGQLLCLAARGNPGVHSRKLCRAVPPSTVETQRRTPLCDVDQGDSDSRSWKLPRGRWFRRSSWQG